MGMYPLNQRRITFGVGVSLLLALVLTIILASTLIAAPTAASLENSTKTANRSEAFPGETLMYTVVISNSGDTAAPTVIMTDTLPAGLTYQTDSLTYTLDSAVVDSFGENNGVINWSGIVSESGSVVINYTAVLTNGLSAGDEIMNAVAITGTGTLITRTATTNIITSTIKYFPIVFKAVPEPNLSGIPQPNSNNQWTVSWSDIGVSGATYELQEDSDANFASPTTVSTGANASHLVSHAASIDNYYCYRVRASANGMYSGWSNVQCAFSNYYADFSTDSGWSIRRQDTDDIENSTYYNNGAFVIKISGRWDYAIAGPMVPAPASSYKIETSIKLTDGIDNLHTYGVIFGGDWNGQPCPVNDYSSCFNHYYRLQVIWFGSDNKMRVDLKRIDYHGDDNSGRGDVKLIDFKDVNVGDPSGWNKWTIEVLADGNIKVYVNDKFIGGGVDTLYVKDPYFAGYAASNEYSGTAANFDWFSVTALP